MSTSEPKVDTELPAAAFSYDIKVLLVDDQPMIGEAIRRSLLGEPEIAFHYCADAKKALATAIDTKPTVILQDLVMPDVSGLELVRQYRGDPRTSGIPVIVLSTKEEPLVKSEAFKVGASDYLVKLPDQIELIARIRHHSMAYMNQLQRDEAYRALGESQRVLMETNLKLQALTNVDGLTGLSNRRYFDEYMDREWKRAMRTETPLSVLMIDVDHFKKCNDTYGHIHGDDVLKKVAAAIKAGCRRAADLPARFGGEEFVVVLPETPYEAVGQLAEGIRGAVAALGVPHSASETAPYVTISVGGATAVPPRGKEFSTLLAAADSALYEAKHTGRNRVVTRNTPEVVAGS